MVQHLTLVLAASILSCPVLLAEESSSKEQKKAPRAEPVRPAQRITAADLELVERIFQKKKSSPVIDREGETVSEVESTWQSYWWSGADALFNTKGLVVTGQTDWGPNWKPYGLIGLEEKVTFESYGKRRDAHLGVGVKYAFTDQLSCFLEVRGLSSSAVPQEGLVRFGIHALY